MFEWSQDELQSIKMENRLLSDQIFRLLNDKEMNVKRNRVAELERRLQSKDQEHESEISEVLIPLLRLLSGLRVIRKRKPWAIGILESNK